MKSDVLVIGVEPVSLINFRGHLIQALEQAGQVVTAVSSPLSSEMRHKFEQAGIRHQARPFQRNGLNPMADFKTLFSLRSLFKTERPDLVLAYTIKPVIWGGLAARLTGTEFYALITGLGFAFQGDGLKRKLLTKLVTALYRLSLSHATKVVFQNEDNRQEFVQRGIVPAYKTEVVNGSGVDISRFAFTPTPALTPKIKFLCIARLLGEKGLREYAQAAALVKAQYRDVEFQLIGPEDTSPDAIAISEVKSWVATGAIEYLGVTEDVRPFIAQSHVYVLPSYHEGLPRSTVEAMAMGKPVITTDAVGCRETVDEGLNGFKVPVGAVQALVEKMVWFIENSAEIQTMGAASRTLAEEKFDVHKVNARMLEIMELKQ